MKLRFSCEQATKLTEKQLRGKISIFQKLALWYHNIICPPCKQYLHQSEFIDQTIEKMCKQNQLSEPEVEELKQKIVESINHSH